jgi:hypothetical protein
LNEDILRVFTGIVIHVSKNPGPFADKKPKIGL